ncbi:MAG: glycosyl hydrolase 2 galactose-binding domain-containing protein [Terriglobia bacterium]
MSPVRSGTWVDAARNRAVYQSSSADDDHTGHLVTDGSTQTYWECEPGAEQWILVDLGKDVPIDHLTIHWGASFARSYRVEVSTQRSGPEHWTVVYATTTGRGGVEVLPLHSVHARHIRLIGSASAADRGFAISELEAWSPNVGGASPKAKQVVSRGGTLLTEGWSLQCAMFAKSGPGQISSPQYTGGDWIPAAASATVLASYLAAGAIPNPNFGNQVAQISDGFFSRNDFWYRNSFAISSACKGRRLWLVFEGINWKADIYLNGMRLGQIDGAFICSRFDITKTAVCGGMNCVAVLIHQVAHPGPVQHKKLGERYRNGGVLGLDSPTFVPSIGWNWVPTIPGRNVGIWNEVRFETSGDVVLIDPWVTSQLPAADNSRAELSARTEVRNLSDETKHCVLHLSMPGMTYQREIELKPDEIQSVVIDKYACAGLAIENPRLWWPNGYGDPILHSMSFQIESSGTISDEKLVTFGIRKLEYQTDGGILRILVNGHRVLCRGGNWGMDDAMLVCDKDGYDLRVRMHHDMNLNMIRNWVGMVGRDAFYDACDRYGVLIWDDFWLANPNDGPNPSDHAMFLNNAVDKIRRIRHHASLTLYCGRNEGMPPPELDAGLRDATAQLDGTRFYIPASDRGPVTGHGPYDNRDPAWYFAHRGTTFHSEQGIVCVPPAESMRAMMPEKDLWPISNIWAIHDYQDPRSVLNTERIEHRYGKPDGIEDYCRKAQMVNLESAKAMYECLRSRQGSGQLVWMTQSAWPALICQLYDYYFEQTAAYFGAKAACEPLHILWDQSSNIVKVANNTTVDRRNLRAEARIYGLDGREQWHKSVDLSAAAASAQDGFPLTIPSQLDRVFFVKLKLSHNDRVRSENFYWSPVQNGDCTALSELPQIGLSVSANIAAEASTRIVSARVSNPNASVALAIRLKVVRKWSGKRVLPAMYEDNYFSLLPHEGKAVGIRFRESALAGEAPRLVVEGWNIREETHAL